MRPSPNLKFRKSSHSADASECVEVADVDGGPAVRDSTRPEHGRLTFPSRELPLPRVGDRRQDRPQHPLTQDDPPDVWAIIHEGALLMLKASPDLFEPQVARLIDLAESPNSVTLQVLPTSAGLHAGMGGPFSILDYDAAQSLVFLETNTDGLYLEKPPEITRYRRCFDRLLAKALDPDAIPDYLRSLTA